MAKYWVNYSCGHSFEEQLYGKHDDRAVHIERQRSRLCPECYRAQRSEQAAAAAKASGLPSLSGSEKQVAWAETIRAQKLAEIGDERARFEARFRRPGAPIEKLDAALAEFDAVIGRVRQRAEARYWIDNRDAGAVALLRGNA